MVAWLITIFVFINYVGEKSHFFLIPSIGSYNTYIYANGYSFFRVDLVWRCSLFLLLLSNCTITPFNIMYRPHVNQNNKINTKQRKKFIENIISLINNYIRLCSYFGQTVWVFVYIVYVWICYAWTKAVCVAHIDKCNIFLCKTYFPLGPKLILC